MIQFNILAILVCTIVHMAIGMVWYSKLMFGKVWMEMIGFTEKDVKDGPRAAMGFALVSAVVTAVAANIIVEWMGTADVGLGLILGLLIIAGFVMPAMVTNAVFEQRKIGVLAIYLGYHLVSYLAIFAIMVAWR